jgi:hypothetical protein
MKLFLEESGGLDSNQRPLAPHTSALPGCATTRTFGAANVRKVVIINKQNKKSLPGCRGGFKEGQGLPYCFTTCCLNDTVSPVISTV